MGGGVGVGVCVCVGGGGGGRGVSFHSFLPPLASRPEI